MIAILLLAGCNGTGDSLTGHAPRPTGADVTPDSLGADGGTCAAGKPHTGFDGRDLTAERATLAAGMDRGRVKPFAALASEYLRVLGGVPGSLAAAADTFGAPPARWSTDPVIGAVGLQSAYGIAFDGCLDYVQSAAFSAAPTPDSATASCATMARALWSRTASPDAIAACASVAVDGTKDEPDVHRRWAYACAAVLTSTGFLTY